MTKIKDSQKRPKSKTVRKKEMQRKVKTEKPGTVNGLNFAQQRFCEEYVYDWNGTRAYEKAYPGTTNETCRVNASKLLTNANVLTYIELLKGRIAEMAGISKLMVVKEAQKLAFSTIAHLHNDWIELSEFNKLTPEQKACIERIETKTEQRVNGMDIAGNPNLVEIKYVKVSLYDKIKALEILNKMMGWNAPEKLDATSGGKPIQTQYDLSKLSTATIKELINAGIINKDS